MKTTFFRFVIMGIFSFLVSAINGFSQQVSLTPEQQEARRKAEERFHSDWPNLARYAGENKALEPVRPGEKRVVFMGNSITEGWKKADSAFFASKGYLDRGISGQTTPQMLLRFLPDVIDLKPTVVVILAGINDIAQNTGPMTL